jgi:hypothetical protein
MRMMIGSLAALLAAAPALAGAVPQRPPLAAGVLAAQDDAGATVDAPAATTGGGRTGITPQLEAEIRGQTTTFTKPLQPVAPVRPQGPRGPIKLHLTPGAGGVQTPAGPQGPVGLGR